VNQAKKPDFLVVMCDQLTPFMLGIYGQNASRTPTIDSLGDNGTVFDAAYCNQPLCVPSRASMFSGFLPCRIRAFDNASLFPANQPTFLHALQRAGYMTVLSGKAHFIGPDQHHGFSKRLTADICTAQLTWGSHWDEPVVKEFGTSIQRGVLTAGVCDRDYQKRYDEEVFFKAQRFLSDYCSEEQTQPLFMMVSSTQPHEPYVAPQKYWDMLEDVEIPEPKVPPQPVETLHQHDKWLSTFHGLDEDTVDRQTVLGARRAYLAMIAYIDEQVGKLVDILRDSRRLENTVIVFTSDHGDMLGERGMWFKRHLFEPSVRVPLIISGPGVKRRREHRAVSLVDLANTFCEMAGTEMFAESENDGDSLVPLLEGKNTSWKDLAICEYCSEGVRNASRMLRKGNYKYVYTHKHPARLYDLASDPNELNDLAGKPKVAEIEQEMQRQCLANWDPDEIEQTYRTEQKKNAFIVQAQKKDKFPDWEARPEEPDIYCVQ